MQRYVYKHVRRCLSHITRNPEVGRRGRGSRSMMALGGWLFLSFCSTLFNVWMSFLMHVTSKLPSGFCILGLKPHLSTFLPEQGGRNRRQWYLHQESRSFPRTPPPPVDVASNTLTQDQELESSNSTLFLTCPIRHLVHL